jgi:hypothetical protein
VLNGRYKNSVERNVFYGFCGKHQSVDRFPAFRFPFANQQFVDFRFCDFEILRFLILDFSIFSRSPSGGELHMPQKYFSIALRFAALLGLAPLRIATCYATDPML